MQLNCLTKKKKAYYILNYIEENRTLINTITHNAFAIKQTTRITLVNSL